MPTPKKASKRVKPPAPKKPSQRGPQPAGSSPLLPFAKRQLRMEIPRLGAQSPGLAWLFATPEIEESADGEKFTVLGNNMAGLWFVLADDGSIHLVDDCEREYGEKIFDSIAELASDIARQNPGA